VSRSPNASALAEIQTALGTEPLIIIEVDWTSSTYSYADKDFLGISGKILSLGGLDSILKIGSSGASGSISVELSDTDGSVKAFWNTVDIHKRPARVYQIFEGLAETDKFLLFSGEVSSPVDWNEGERTISFDIVSTIEDKQLGFSPEEGEFDFIAESAVGVPWPLCYGDVVRVPATRITEAVRGTTLSRYGQITAPELEQLCGLSVALQQAESAKAVADLLPGFLDSNYAIVIDNIDSATISLNEFLAGLIFDSPTQETNLYRYSEICKELERWRVFYDQELAKYQDAEQRRLPLESTPGKPAVTGFKFFSQGIESIKYTNSGETIPTFAFGEEEKDGYRVAKDIPAFGVTIRPAVPETVGAVDQAYEAKEAYHLANYPFSSSEEWDTYNALLATYEDLYAALNIAIADSTSALNNLLLANSNIFSLNTEKKTLERTLLQFVLTTIIVEGGENFPQATEVEIIINGLHYKGQFVGRTFTIAQANTPADVNVAITASTKPNEFLLSDPTIQMKGKFCLVNNGITFVENQDGARCSISPILFYKTGTVGGVGLQHDIYDFRYLSGTISQTSVFMSIEWIELVRSSGVPDYATGLSVLRQRDYGFDVGDDVYLASDYKEIYIANLIPSTSIKEVMAYRVLDGVKKLLPIPSRYYDVNLNESIAGQNATTIRFKRPLTEFYGENWEDQIYVSLVSSVGPNTVDVIGHLVDTYTDLTKDATSFASVRAAIDAFPSSFALLDRRSTFGTIEEIAWQARCAAFIKEDTIYLKYLAVEEAAIDTLDENTVDEKTLNLSLTPTEDLITEFKAAWDSDYSAERRNSVILRNNIGKYGTMTQEHDFYIYNVQELVVKSATFWLIRQSNTWKILSCQAPLVLLRLETFDTVELDFAQDWIASGIVKGTVEDVVYNSETFELDFNIRTSVRAGELTSYILNWPAGVAVDVEYPTPDDHYAGGASG